MKTRKLSRVYLEHQHSELSSEVSLLTMALSDVLGKNPVTWFYGQDFSTGESRNLKFGVSRELGAMGGLVIIQQEGIAIAYCFEEWFQRWRDVDVTGSESARVYRDLAHEVAQHVRKVQEGV